MNAARPPGPDTTAANPCPDADACALLLRRVEATHDQRGWQPRGAGGGLCVYIVYDHHDVITEAQFARIMDGMGEPVRTARYTARPMLAPRIFHNGHLDGGLTENAMLANFVNNMAYADPDQPVLAGDEGQMLSDVRGMLRMSGIAGFAACYEAFGRRPADRADFLATMTGAKHLGDYPDGFEVRIAVMVDTADRVHRVERRRGQPPAVAIDGPWGGDMTTSLRILTDLACDRLPADGKAYTRRYPSLQELAERDGA